MSVLLAGGIKPAPLVAAAGMSVLDLLAAPTASVLHVWAQRLRPLGVRAETAGIPEVRVLHCASTPRPSDLGADSGLRLLVREDPQHYRGPAGIARDACADEPEDAPVLLAEAGRLLTCDLGPMADRHFRTGADITVAANADGSPAGVYIARCGTLGLVPARGFMDLKEQWLDRALSQGKKVFVYRLPGAGALPLRTREQYLRACVPFGPLWTEAPSPWPGRVLREQRGGCARSLVSPSAVISQDALVTQSVVMAGAVIEPGAVVARSVIAPGVRVPQGSAVVDAVAAGGRVQLDDGRVRRGSEGLSG